MHVFDAITVWRWIDHVPFPIGESVSQIMELCLQSSAAIGVHGVDQAQIRALLAVTSEVFRIQEDDFKASAPDLLEFDKV